MSWSCCSTFFLRRLYWFLGTCTFSGRFNIFKALQHFQSALSKRLYYFSKRFFKALLLFFKALLQSTFIIFRSTFIKFKLKCKRALIFYSGCKPALIFILLSMKQCPIFVQNYNQRLL
jgi:hypothetical protein